MRITTDISRPLIDFVRNDCEARGRGGKKWWASKLEVSQMTLSHWLVGRREPNAFHMSAFYIAFEESQANKEKAAWTNWLWQNYYENRELDPALLKAVALQLVKADGLQSRTWALLSWYLAKYGASPFKETELLAATRWSNKVGWLYESAGLEVHVEPIRSSAPGMILDIAVLDLPRGDKYRSYLERQQTALGKKWFLYDCPLERLKEKLSWRQ